MTPPLDSTQPVLNDQAVVKAILQSFCTDVAETSRSRLLHSEADVLQHIFAIRPRLVYFTHRHTTSMRHPSMSMAVRQYFLSYRAALQRAEERRRAVHMHSISTATTTLGGSVSSPPSSIAYFSHDMFPRPITPALLKVNNWELVESAHTLITGSSQTIRYAARLVATDDLVNDAIVRFWDRLTVVPHVDDHASVQSVGDVKGRLSHSLNGVQSASHALVMTSMQYVYLHLRIATVLLPPDTINFEMLDAIASDLRADAALRTSTLSFGSPPSRIGCAFSPDEIDLNSNTPMEDTTTFQALSHEAITRATLETFSRESQSEDASSQGWSAGENAEAMEQKEIKQASPDAGEREEKAAPQTKPSTDAPPDVALSGQLRPTDAGVTLSMLPDVTFAQFWQSMLELADNWTSSSHPMEYVAFLIELYCEVFAHDWDEEDETFKKALRTAMERRAGPGRRSQKSGLVSMPPENEQMASDVMSAFNDMWPTFDVADDAVGSELNSFTEGQRVGTGKSVRHGSSQRLKKLKARAHRKSGSAASRSDSASITSDLKYSGSLVGEEMEISGSLSFAEGDADRGRVRSRTSFRKHRSRPMSGSRTHRRHHASDAYDERSDEGSYSSISSFEGSQGREHRRSSRSPHGRSKKRRSGSSISGSSYSSGYSIYSDGGETRLRRKKSSYSRRHRDGEKGEGRRHSRHGQRRHSRHGRRSRQGRHRGSSKSGSFTSSVMLSSMDSGRLSSSFPMSLVSILHSVPDEELTPHSRERRMEERRELRRRREEYRNRRRHRRRRDRDRREGSFGDSSRGSYRGNERGRHRHHDRDDEREHGRSRGRRREGSIRREREHRGEGKPPRLIGKELEEKRQRMMEMLRMKGIQLKDDFLTDEELQRMEEDGAIDPALLERLMRSAAGIDGNTLSEEDFLHILLGDGDGKAAGGKDLDAATTQSVLDALRRRRDMGRLETQAERHKRKMLEKKLRDERRAQRRAEREAAKAAAQALADARGEERPPGEIEDTKIDVQLGDRGTDEKPQLRVLQPLDFSTMFERESSTDSLVGLWIPQPPAPTSKRGTGVPGSAGVSDRPRLPSHTSATPRPSEWRLCVEPREAEPQRDLHEFSPTRLELFYKNLPKDKPCHTRAPLAPLTAINGGTYHQLPSISMRYGGGINVRPPPAMQGPQRCAPVKLFSLTKKRTLAGAIKESLRRYVDDKNFLEILQKSDTTN